MTDSKKNETVEPAHAASASSATATATATSVLLNTPTKPKGGGTAAGGKKRGRKTKTQEEFENRIRFTSMMVGQRMFKGDIKRVLKQRWGVSARMSEIYITRARKLLVKQAGKDIEDHRTDAYSFYNAVLNDPRATLRDKMWAQTRIDSLFGLEIHTVKHQGDAAQPIQHRVLTLDPVAIIEKAKQLREEGEAKRVSRYIPPATDRPGEPAGSSRSGTAGVERANEAGQEVPQEETIQGQG